MIISWHHWGTISTIVFQAIVTLFWLIISIYTTCIILGLTKKKKEGTTLRTALLVYMLSVSVCSTWVPWAVYCLAMGATPKSSFAIMCIKILIILGIIGIGNAFWQKTKFMRIASVTTGLISLAFSGWAGAFI
jgi:threonine/homoserine efflux transporter RhtA